MRFYNKQPARVAPILIACVFLSFFVLFPDLKLIQQYSNAGGLVVTKTLHTSSSPVAATKKEGNPEAAQFHWTRYRRAKGDGTKNILIAQQSGNQDKYRHLLDLTQRTNRAYARKWNYDYVALTGLALGGYKNYHANFNKIYVLEQAMSLGEYDGVLLLDADALVRDMDVFVEDQLYPDYAIIATSCQAEKDPHSWLFNNGVVLWNLQHKMAPWLIKQWKRLARVSIQANLQKHKVGELLTGDQTLLDVLVLSRSVYPGRKHVISTNSTNLPGSFIKHVTRKQNTEWNLAQSEQQRRVDLCIQVANETCAKFHPVCEDIPYEIE